MAPQPTARFRRVALALSVVALLGLAQTDFASVFTGIARGMIEANVDLVLRRPVLYVSGMRDGGAPHVDPDTGLLYRPIAGCMVTEHSEAREWTYNERVKAWIKANGLPKNSLRSRFVDGEALGRASRLGAWIEPGEALQVASDRAVLRAEDGEELVFIGGSRRTSLTLHKGKMRVHWPDPDHAFVTVDEGPTRHIDVETGRVLQSCDAMLGPRCLASPPEPHGKGERAP